MYKIKVKYILSLLLVTLFFGGAVTRGGANLMAQELSAPELSDSLLVDSLSQDSLSADTVARRAKRSSLDDVLSGKNKDSVYYDVKRKMVHIYNEGKVDYQDNSLEAEYMRINMETNDIYAYGRADTVEGEATVIKPVFSDGGSSYTMDTISYNIKSEKAKIKGIATQEGEGWLVAQDVKMVDKTTINIQNGKYTTCDHTDHPHFYLAMTKAKMIPDKKIVTGPAYMVIEDVPLYFIGIPEGFFPINSGPKSGLLMPTYGEEASRGFYLRDLGYYFVLNDHMDLSVTGGIYSLGSWETSASSSYTKRYKYSGSFAGTYSSVVVGEKDDEDYTKSNNVSLKWTHTQDSKANPNSSFSASVNFATSGYSKYSATTLTDMLSTQTNSSIAYSRTWSNSSLSTNMAISQNSQTEAISMTFPSLVYNVSRFYPFKRKEQIGGERWYEKISMSYTGKMTNSVSTTESEFFTEQTFEDMSNGISHSIPVSASFSLFDYINLTPSFNYSEEWYFKKVEKEYDLATSSAIDMAPEYGFYRLYDYTTSLSASTTVYGMFQARRENAKLKAVRHTLTPSFGFSYNPNFQDQKFGYYQTVQSDSLGGYTTYSPYSTNAYGVPSSGESFSMNFGLSQSLEMKVASKRDTSGMKKITLIEDLSLSASYNMIADSMRLSTIPVSLRTTIFGNFGINLSLTLDPYKVSPEGVRYDELFLPGRVTSTGWSFGYTFKSRANKTGSAIALNDITSVPAEYQNPFYDPRGELDPTLRRQYMSQSYYDFSLPWNLGFNYVVSYGINYVDNGTTGYEPNITQSVGFNGSLTLTEKWGVAMSGGFDIQERELTTSSISISRDLHCWQMSFSWIPYGYYKSWSFNIGIKASSLSDLKYDKSQSMYDNIY